MSTHTHTHIPRMVIIFAILRWGEMLHRISAKVMATEENFLPGADAVRHGGDEFSAVEEIEKLFSEIVCVALRRDAERKSAGTALRIFRGRSRPASAFRVSSDSFDRHLNLCRTGAEQRRHRDKQKQFQYA